MKVRIHVTAEDIDQGCPNKGDSCPVALAIKRATAWPYVRVGKRVILAANSRPPHETRTLFTPPKAQQFIEQFDEGRPVRPILFWLDVPAGLEPTNQTGQDGLLPGNMPGKENKP